MNRSFLYFLTALFLISCSQSKGPKKPERLIAEKKMVEILIDFSLLKSMKNTHNQLFKDSIIDIETYIFKKHQIDSIQFAESNRYYTYQSNTYERIFRTVKDQLEFQKKQWQKEEELERKKRDSTFSSKKKDTLLK